MNTKRVTGSITIIVQNGSEPEEILALSGVDLVLDERESARVGSKLAGEPEKVIEYRNLEITVLDVKAGLLDG